MKISRFTNILKKDSYLIHNTLSNGVIKVNSNELKEKIDKLEKIERFPDEENDEFFESLKKLNIVVKDEEDEMATLNSLFFHFENESELSIMLIVTRRCNFRCTYCYEEYENRDMSPEVFDNARSYIINQIKRKKFKNVYLSFFGGEPTLMAKEINSFMHKLLEENKNLEKPADIKAVITTNGYLLTPDMLDEFISNRIIRYQITLDGLEEQHNKSRYLIGEKGTWSKIVENLNYFKQVQDDDVSVLIRTNITPEIYENIEAWLEYLHDNFSNDKKFKVHFEAAKDFGNMNDQNFNLIEDEKETIIDIIERSKKWKLPLELVGFRTTPFSMVCYAARQFSYIIDWDGTVKKCTSSSLDEPYNEVGYLNGSEMEINIKEAAQWTSYELKEKCYKCPILPLCYARKCPVCKNTDYNCDYLVESYFKGLEYCYL